MNVALFEPYSPELLRGNSIAAERLATSLSHYGVSVRFFSLHNGHNKTRIAKQLHPFQPDLLHGFHACKTGPLVKEISESVHVPYIISMRGTDAYEDAFKKPACRKMKLVLNHARKIVVFHPFMKKTLLKNFPLEEKKIEIIAQGVDINSMNDRNVRTKKQNGTVAFGYAGGIRKLKGIHFIIAALKEARKTYPHIHFYMAGPVVEKNYAKKILTDIKNEPWITYLGEIPHKDMASFYRRIDVYVNASSSEGTSNALLEAMSSKKCALASDAEGNRAIIRNGKNGFLFTTQENFIQKIIFLLSHKQKRERAGTAAKQYAAHFHSAEREAENYYELYRRSLRLK